MKAKDAKEVRFNVENEGFDYCFIHYSHFEEIKDEEFHKLRNAYIKARNDLAELIGLEEG